MRWCAGVSRLLPWCLFLTLACGAPPLSSDEEAPGPEAVCQQEAAHASGGLGDPHRIEDLVPGRLSSGPYELTDVDGLLLFGARDAEHGAELWRSSGTSRSTRLVVDLRPGPEGSEPRDLAAAGRRLFFTADDGVRGRVLWTSDGTAEGTRLVVSSVAGVEGFRPGAQVVVGGVLYFSEFRGASEECCGAPTARRRGPASSGLISSPRPWSW
jgi:ELWxxDGT repeat protein